MNAPNVMHYRNVLGFVVVLPRSKVRPSVGFMVVSLLALELKRVELELLPHIQSTVGKLDRSGLIPVPHLLSYIS